jgi:hypothetical protein
MQVVLEDIQRTLGAKEVCIPRYPDRQPKGYSDGDEAVHEQPRTSL